MADGEVDKLSIKVEVDSSGVKTGIKEIKGQLGTLQDKKVSVEMNSGQFNSDINSMVKQMNGFGDVASKAFQVNQIIQFGQAIKGVADDLINLTSSFTDIASDLAEVQNVVDVTYGTMQTDVQEFADTAIESYGLSELAAKNYVGTLGAIMKSAGFATNDALAMSETITKLSADDASFFNKSVDEVYTKLRSGIISGETEAIKDLGLNMNVASLNAYAMANGITKAYADMSSQEQLLLRYNFVMQNSSIMMGDFARTSDSWANSTKTLGQQFDALKGKIGTGLIQVFTPALQVISQVLQGLNAVIEKVYTFLGLSTHMGSTYDNIASNGMQKKNDGTIDISKPLTPVEQSSAPTFNIPSTNSALKDTNAELGKAAKNANKTGDGLKKANDNAKKLKRTVSGFDEANVLSDNSSVGNLADTIGKINDANNALGGSTAALGAMASALTDAYGEANKVVSGINSDADDLSDMFGNVHLNMKQVKEIADQIVGKGDLKEIGRLTKEIDKLDGIHENLNKIKTDLNTYDWMVNMGIQLTPDEYKDYKKKVWEYADEVQSFIKQQGVVVKLSADILFGADSSEGTEAEKFYQEMQKKAKTISDKMKDAFSKAFDANGRLISIDSYKEFENYQKQLSDLENKISNYEVNVELNKLNFKASGANLDEESFDALMKQMKETIQKKIDGYQTAAAEYKAYLQTRLEMGEISQADYDKEMKKVEKSLNDKITSANQAVVKFAVDTMISFTTKDSEIKKTFEEFTKGLNEKMTGFANAYDQGNWAEALFQMDGIVKGLDSEIDKYSPELRKCAKKVLAEMDVSSDDLQKQVDSYKAAGQKIPQALQDQLTNVKVLEALSGDTKAILWLVGNQLKGTEYETMIKNAKAAGKNVPDELINGMDSKKVDLNNGTAGLLSGVSTELTKNNKAKDNANKSGTEIGSSYVGGVNGAKVDVSNLVNGVFNAFNKDNGTSSVAESRGKDIGNSYVNGINNVPPGMAHLFGNVKNAFTSDENTGITANKKGSAIGGTFVTGINSPSVSVGTIMGHTKSAFNSDYYTGVTANKKGGAIGGTFVSGINKTKINVSSFFNKVKNTVQNNGTATGGFKNLANNCASGYNYRLSGKSVWGVKDFIRNANNSGYSNFGISGGKSSKFSYFADCCARGYANLNNGRNRSATRSSVASWCGLVLSVVSGALMIHSPSRKFGEFAKFSVEGYNNNIEKGYGDTERTMRSWGNYISDCGEKYMTNEFSTMTPKLTGTVTEQFNASVTGSLQSAVSSVMDNMKFYANVKVGNDIQVVEFVNQYNQMASANPNFGFVV